MKITRRIRIYWLADCRWWWKPWTVTDSQGWGLFWARLALNIAPRRSR